MSKKILIAYGTRYGSARIVAEDIAEFLGNKGAQVEVVDLKKGRPSAELEEYDLIVAGSSVAMFSWVRAVKQFLRKCRKASVKTAVFVTCGKAMGDFENAKAKYLNKVTDRIGLQPVLSQPISPIIDFRPDEGLPTGLKGRIKGTIQGMAKDDFREDELMDFRDEERFKGFLEKLGEFI